MSSSQPEPLPPSVERQRMDVDIACVGFGPAMGGFLSTLSRRLVKEDGSPAVPSSAMPGMPPQVVCYERADDIGFGVSGGRYTRQGHPRHFAESRTRPRSLLRLQSPKRRSSICWTP